MELGAGKGVEYAMIIRGRSAGQRAAGYVSAVSGVALVVTTYTRWVTSVNVTTVALTLLMVVLLMASLYGLGPAILASVLGMLCFNFFFLPPIGTLTIADPQNWVALAAFLATAVVASHLSSTAHTRATEAEQGREEIWRLYQLSRAIMATPDSESAVSSVARAVVEIFGVPYCAVWTPLGKGDWQPVAVASEASPPEIYRTDPGVIQTVFNTGEIEQRKPSFNAQLDPTLRKALAGRVMTYAPLKVGVRTTGVLVIMAESQGQGTVEAIAGQLALAVERARFLQVVSRTEALRQSDDLKSALLASISHSLRTPLTAIRVAIDNLLQEDLEWDPTARREFHLIISEETYRLTRVVQNLLDMARIEAGELRAIKEPGSVPELIGQVLERCAAITRDHRVTLDLPRDTPLAPMDAGLMAEVLTNLLENAVKYSSPGQQIILSARVRPDELCIGIRDQGPGITRDEMEHVFDKFYRGAQAALRHTQGTGMGLTIARGIVEAHGGHIDVESVLGEGSTFWVCLPIGSGKDPCEESAETKPYDSERL